MNRDWQQRAQCIGVDPTLFSPQYKGRVALNPGRVATAKNICQACTVKKDCLEAGEGAPGIWGGLEEYERKPAARGHHGWNPRGVQRDIDLALKP